MRTGTFFSMVIVLFAITVGQTHGAVGIFDQSADWTLAGNENKVDGSITVSGSGEDAVYTINGNGRDIWNDQDEGFFAYTERSGSYSISGKITWIDPGVEQWNKFGPMIRQYPQEPGGVYYGAMAKGTWEYSSAQWRTELNGTPGVDRTRFQNQEGNIVPLDGGSMWLRLTRVEDKDWVFAEFSSDGDNWMLGHSMVLPMNDAVAYGFAITSHTQDDFSAVGEITDVKLDTFQSPIAWRSIKDDIFQNGKPTSISIEVANPGAAILTETIPEGWDASEISNDGSLSGHVITWNLTDSDTEVNYNLIPQNVDLFSSQNVSLHGSIGDLPVIGDFTKAVLPGGLGDFEHQILLGNADLMGLEPEYDNGTYYLSAGGGSISSTDNMYFIFNELNGPFRLKANVILDPAGGDATNARAGLFIRDSLEPDAVYTSAQLLSDNSLRMQSRKRVADTEADNVGNVPEDVHGGNIEILRSGDVVSVLYTNSSTGEKTVLTTTRILNWDDPVFAGLGVTSWSGPENLSFADFSAVELTQYELFATREIPTLYYDSSENGAIENITLNALACGDSPVSGIIREFTPDGITASNISVTNGGFVIEDGVIVWTITNLTGSAQLTYNAEYEAASGFEKVGLLFDGTSADSSGDEIPIAGDYEVQPIIFSVPYIEEANITLDGLIGDGEYAETYTEMFDNYVPDPENNPFGEPPGVHINGNTNPPEIQHVVLYLLHNQDYLYVAADVLDPNIVLDQSAPWANDSAVLYLDGNFTRLTRKEANQYGFGIGVVVDGHVNYGDGSVPNAATPVEGDGFYYTTNGVYLNYAARIKNDNSGYVVEFVVDKSQALDPPDRNIIGFDFKMIDPTDGLYAYWHMNAYGVITENYKNDETGWAVISLQQDVTGIQNWSLF